MSTYVRLGVVPGKCFHFILPGSAFEIWLAPTPQAFHDSETHSIGHGYMYAMPGLGSMYSKHII